VYLFERRTWKKGATITGEENRDEETKKKRGCTVIFAHFKFTLTEWVAFCHLLYC
jgi:hypothetical protein